MGTGAKRDQRTNTRSVIRSVAGMLLLAGLVAMGLELVTMGFAAPHSAAQALGRTSEGFVALERHIERSGTLIGYPLQF